MTIGNEEVQRLAILEEGLKNLKEVVDKIEYKLDEALKELRERPYCTAQKSECLTKFSVVDKKFDDLDKRIDELERTSVSPIVAAIFSILIGIVGVLGTLLAVYIGK